MSSTQSIHQLWCMLVTAGQVCIFADVQTALNLLCVVDDEGIIHAHSINNVHVSSVDNVHVMCIQAVSHYLKLYIFLFIFSCYFHILLISIGSIEEFLSHYLQIIQSYLFLVVILFYFFLHFMHENSISIIDFSKLDSRIKVMLIMVLTLSHMQHYYMYIASLTNTCIAHIWNTQSHVQQQHSSYSW